MGARDQARPTRFGTLALRGCALAALLLAVQGLYSIGTQRVGLGVIMGQTLWLGLGVLVASLVAGLQIVRAAFTQATNAARELRLFVCAAAITWLAFLLLVPTFQRVWFDLGSGSLALVWLGLSAGVERGVTRPRLRRIVEFVLFAVALALPLTELALRTAASLRPSQVLTRVGDAPRRLIERFRCAPGLARFGFPCNSRGFYDDEFVRRAADAELVVSIGDSFNVGSVPHAWHMSTVCEAALAVEVANIGVAGIGPAEYTRLLIDEGLPLDPTAVVFNIFVGNDLAVADVESHLPDQGLRDWFARERVLLFVVPERLARIAAEQDRSGGRSAGSVQGARIQAPGDVRERFPWLADPSLEQANLSEATHLRLEVQRARDICAADPVSLPVLYDALETARAAVGDGVFAVVLIPDEFQVDDGLWASVTREIGRELDRDRPQRVINAWLAERDIPTLDLLPVLRAVPALDDGERHVYHLRDTHFNARGNRVAGEALAEFLKPLLAR